MSTDVSEEHNASIFRVEEETEQETSVEAGGKQSSANSSTLKMEATCSSETSGDIQWTSRRTLYARIRFLAVG
jgi:hypothetical protein